jgi:hypothetical protein
VRRPEEFQFRNAPLAMLPGTFLGYLLGKSMLETGGLRWVRLIHWLQDVIIFPFLVMGWSS